MCSLQLVKPFGNGSCGDLWVGVNWPWTTKEMFQSCGQKNNFREWEGEKNVLFMGMVGFEWGICVFDGRSDVSLDGRWALLGGEKFIGFCGTEEGALGEKILSGFWKFLFCFYFFRKNIVLTWKIVRILEASVLYRYIDYMWLKGVRKFKGLRFI